MDQSMGEMRHGAPSLDLNASGPVCSAHPGESQASMSIAVGEEIHGKDFLDDGTSVKFSARCTEATNGWTRRVRIGKAPVEREMSAARKSALELSVRAYITKRDGNVANPVIGTSFDSIDRLTISIIYIHGRLVLGKPVKDNTRSSRCGCNAMIMLLRSEDNGWYIYLVTQLRQNNVSLGKVFRIVGSFFGCIENVPFTKRAFKTLCGKINKEHSDSDARKTMDILSEMKANDPAFNYTVQVDEEGRIKTLMWVNGNSIDQYMCFRDAITFDTTYRTNLYDMPFGLFVGVNNHFQSIIFGEAMLRDEKEDTFRWVFHQACSMEIAIEAELPNTVHRDFEESFQEKRTSLLDGGGNVLPIPHEASHSSSLATAIDEASVLGQGPIARCAVDDSRDGTQIAALEEHVYIEEGTGDFDPMVAGVCCAEELVLDDGDNASCVGGVDDKADEDDAESRPTKRAKL
ncbi:hypothetical protein D1007_25276 [Hordeum vulgare]|nr:hypothetical protein D1007_25276 [Hordeum vulgare]